MRSLHVLATEAAKELNQSPLPHDRPATRELAKRIAKMVETMEGLNFKRWRTIAKRFSEKLPNDDDVHFWACGISGEIALLAVSGQHLIPEARLLRDVLKLIRVIRDVTRHRPGKKKKK